MAGSLNKVQIIGNLGADPECRQTNDGRPVVNLRIATTDKWRNKSSGEMQERTEWHRVVVFNENICKVAEAYLRKGSRVYLEGALQTRKYTDQQGIERFSTEIVVQQFRGEMVLLDGKPERDDEQPARQSISERAAPRGPASKDLDDQVPF